MDGTIYFFGAKGPSGYLSNFYEAPFEYRGNTYGTVENFFQSMKARNREDREAIRLAPTPGKAKGLGRRCAMRPDWEVVKPAFMYLGLRLKFDAHRDLAKRLVATDGALLVENNTNDFYWGAGDGSGSNQLGRLLMLVRSDLMEDTL